MRISYWVVSVLVVSWLVVMLVLISKPRTPSAPGDRSLEPGAQTTLLLYCAAGMKNPVEEVAKAYEAECGVRVDIQYGGSGTLLSNLKVVRQGDLYLAADTSYIELARKDGLVAEALPVAHLRPVIAVKRGNPLGIEGQRDLLREGLKVALANPDAASVGKQTKLLFTKKGMWDELAAAVQARGVYKPTVNEVANDVKLGTVDAGVVWDATVNQYPELEAVPIEDTDDFVKQITVGVLTATTQPTAALRFGRFLTARDRGLPVFKRMGFPPVTGDKWAVTPEITYFAGGVNRVGIAETLKAFGEREGVRITTVYNGCGILLGQIKLGQQPDAYQTCDASFMSGVESRFTPAEPLTETAMVIVTAKGNPLGLKTLADLDREGIRLGLANEEQSALGALTARLLKAQGLYEQVRKRVVAESPTADLLVNQLRTGALDAAIVYQANTTASGDAVTVVPIELPTAKAVQTFSVSLTCDYPQLMERLRQRLHSAQSRQRYTAAGFTYLGPEDAP